MRIPKYQAWNKKLKRIHDVLEIELNPEFGGVKVWDKGHIDDWAGEREVFWFLRDCELRECTGLKDKNGKDIYEGDILLVEGFDIGGVEYGKACFFVRCNNDDRIALEDTSVYLIEVIGNIYEHPELLGTSL